MNKEYLGGLFNFPRIVCHQQFFEVVILLLGRHLFDLLVNGIVVSIPHRG